MQSVLFVNYEYPPIGAGGATANYHFATLLAAEGIRVTVVTSAFREMRGTAMEEGVTVYRIPAWREHAGQSSLRQMLAYLLGALLHLPKVIPTQQPDMAVVFFSFPCGPAGILLKRLWNIPFTVMLRGGDVPGFEPSLDRIHRLLQPIRKSVYNNACAIIANSESLRDLALQSDPDTAISIIPNGVDTEFYRPPDNRTVAGDHPFTFLFAGRICTQKNLDIMIMTFSRCRLRKDTLRLIIIGEGPERSRLQQLADSRSPGNRIHWVGWCSKTTLREYYRTADCFVSPSTAEGMSNALLEAMACGLPVLAGDCRGNREIVDEGVNGFLFTPSDGAMLEEKMILLAENRSLCNQWGSEGRRRCMREHSWTAITGQLKILLEAGMVPR